MSRVYKKREYHDLRNSPEYVAWANMRARCNRSNHPKYADYGGRGIKVCDRWELSFMDFLRDVGFRPDSTYSLDRKDNNGDYEPGNIRWSTRSEQQINRRANHFLTFKGETLTISQWAEKLGVTHTLIDTRIRRGWPVERALS